MDEIGEQGFTSREAILFLNGSTKDVGVGDR